MKFSLNFNVTFDVDSILINIPAFGKPGVWWELKIIQSPINKKLRVSVMRITVRASRIGAIATEITTFCG